MTERVDSPVCARIGDHSKYGFTNVGPPGAAWWVCAKPGCLLPTRLYLEAMEKHDA